MLIVVENRNLHALTQLLFDVEALGRLDVLKVDAAKGRLKRRDHVDQLVRITLFDFKVEDVDVGKFLEQNTLAFHHRFGRQRPDVAKAEHGCSVGNDANEVGA